MTPRQYAAILDQHKLHIRHKELLSAIIAGSIVNTMGNPEKPIPYAKFMPCEWAKEEVKKPRKKRVSKAERDFINSKIHCFLAARAVPLT